MEKRTQRNYTPEQRSEAVALANETTPKEAASQLGIPEDTLYGWVVKARKGLLEKSSKPTPSTDDEVERLRAEIVAIKSELKSEKSKILQLEKEKKIQDDVIDFFVNRQKK